MDQLNLKQDMLYLLKQNPKIEKKSTFKEKSIIEKRYEFYGALLPLAKRRVVFI